MYSLTMKGRFMKARYSNTYEPPAHGRYVIELKRALQRLSPSDEGAVQPFPTPLTPLIGREQEVGALCALLLQPEVRLLTVTGPGGVGKTCLALQIAANVCSAFDDGMCFVSLAPIRAVDLLLPTIASAVGLKQGHDSLARVQAAIGDKHFLLLLDNFEQIADGVSQVKALLSCCSHLKIMITSRSTLRILEEHEFSVAPLALPDLTHPCSIQDLAQVAAVSLFLQRTWTLHPDFILTSENAPAVAQICVRLDGLPLALELAAVRMKLFSPQSLLARLGHRLSFLTNGTRDAPERQQTLRKSMEWSYQMLLPEEQRLLRRLSVFVGGGSLQAIEAISDATGPQEKPLLDVLSSLLNQSVLQRKPQAGTEEPRFTMLETMQEYALEGLHNSDEEEIIRQMHACYYLGQAEIRERQGMEGEGPHWIEWIGSEFENLRVACGWLLSSPEREQILFQKASQTDLPSSLAVCLVGMGAIMALQKHYSWAVRLWGKAKALSKRRDGLSEERSLQWVVAILGTHLLSSQVMGRVRTQLDRQAFTAAWKEGEAMTLEHLLTRPDPEIISTSSSPTTKGLVVCSQGLTPRQREVLHLLAQGLSSALIAERLIISLTTVNSHVRTIYTKLGVSSRSAATRYAMAESFNVMVTDLTSHP